MADNSLRGRIFRKSVLLLFGLLAALTDGTDISADSRQPVPPERIAVCIGGGPGIPAMLAQEQGLFRSEGLDATLKKYAAGMQAFEGLLAGECDLALAGETPVVMKSFVRQDFSVLATLATSDDVARVVANSERGIQRPEDLRGKRIMVHKGTTNHFFLEMFLLKKGISEKDVTLSFELAGDVAEALNQGKIDAFAGTDALISKPRRALGDRAVVFSSPGTCLATVNVLAMNKLIAEKPRVVRAALAAFLKTEEFVEQNRPQAIQIVSRSLNLNEKEATGLLDSYRWNVRLAQTLFLSMEHEAQWALERGLVRKTAMPNYLNYVHADALRSLKPEAVTMK